MKGSAITGPVGKEAAELWPVRHPILPQTRDNIQLTYSSVSLPTPVSSCKKGNPKIDMDGTIPAGLMGCI